MTTKQAVAMWTRSFYTRLFDWRLLLTPLGTINICYNFGDSQSISYKDIYVFGVRIARIQL